MRLEATHMRGVRYAVRPEGQLGTCGFHPEPWTVEYVNASSPENAVRKAIRLDAARKTSVLGRPHLAVDQETGELI